MTFVLEPAQLGIGGLELLLLAPLTEGPCGSPVNTCVGVVAVEGKQLGGELVAFAGGKPIVRVGPEGLNHGPPYRGFGVEEDGLDPL